MADDSQLSSLIDNEGRLFGLVNIVDILVVLLVLAVGVAGFALVTGGSAGEQETRFVTVDLGSQPGYIAEQITVGDEWDVQGSDSFTITDVYRAPAIDAENDTQVLLRAQINGTPLGNTQDVTAEQQLQPISFNGGPLRFGDQLKIQTNKYRVAGTVTAIGQTEAELPTQSRGFVIEATVDRSVADQIDAGDRFVSGGTEQLRVETANVYPTLQEDVRRVVVGITAQTQVEGGVTLYGSQPIQPGTAINVRTETYQLAGNIVTVGGVEPPGTASSRTVTIDVENIAPERANAITTGATEQSQDIITAQVLSKVAQPATETIQSGGGFQTIEHPTQLDLTMDVELSVREFQDGRIQFRGESVNTGDTLSVALDGIVVEGIITEIS
jgi:guanyl-specific ribonuclease Sa